MLSALHYSPVHAKNAKIKLLQFVYIIRMKKRREARAQFYQLIYFKVC